MAKNRNPLSSSSERRRVKSSHRTMAPELNVPLGNGFAPIGHRSDDDDDNDIDMVINKKEKDIE